ncbi:MAG TPA: cyclic nucleotide-binding domain-containing protein [Stellaceae bacterium]|nr:cyclic nucleotide-binding domain-containing protein [Stellaceae bacterium]
MSGVNWANQQPEDVSRQKTDAEKPLDLVTIFATLTADERKTIATKLKQRSYDEGETLIEPGSVVHSLFIVGAGVLSLTRDETEGEMEVTRLGPGDHYGEIGMLTGAPSIAKITALIPSAVYELAKQDLAPILEPRPQVAQELSRALARRGAASRATVSTEIDEAVPTNGLTAWFSERLHRLHDLADAR